MRCTSVVMRRAPDAPSGWPSAMAPPSRFSWAGSAPMSASHASGTGANASLTSKAPISSSRSPDRASAFCVAGVGGGQHGRVHAGDGYESEPARLLGGGHEQGRGAVGDLGRVARGDHTVAWAEHGGERGEGLRGRTAAHPLVADDEVAAREPDR